MLNSYKQEAAERKEQGIPPLPLTPEQTIECTNLLEKKSEESAFLLTLLTDRVEPGVSKSARVKAAWLKAVALGAVSAESLSPTGAVRLLAEMGGGYNVEAMVALLEVDAVAKEAAEALKMLTKVYDGFDKVAELSQNNPHAKDVILSWAKAEWFTRAEPLPAKMELTVYKVDGEINTDDFSPGNQAQSRADIPLHAEFFGVSRFPDGIKTIAGFRGDNKQVVFAGDVVGTGSSRKSAVNSLLWHTGEDIPGVPNKRVGGVVLGGSIAPIFYATARDAGIMPIECDMGSIKTGDSLTLDLENWQLTDQAGAEVSMQQASPTLLDEYRACGRLNLIIGKQLTRSACTFLHQKFPEIFVEVQNPQPTTGQGYCLAQ